MGFEPTTSTLARLRSTPELRPRSPYITPLLGHCKGFTIYVNKPSIHSRSSRGGRQNTKKSRRNEPKIRSTKSSHKILARSPKMECPRGSCCEWHFLARIETTQAFRSAATSGSFLASPVSSPLAATEDSAWPETQSLEAMQRLLASLDELKISWKLHQHEPLFTVE